jgi:hypothetical protein
MSRKESENPLIKSNSNNNCLNASCMSRIKQSGPVKEQYEDQVSDIHQVSGRGLFSPEYIKNCSFNAYLKSRREVERSFKIKKLNTLRMQFDVAKLNFGNLHHRFNFSNKLEFKSLSVSDIYELKSKVQKKCVNNKRVVTSSSNVVNTKTNNRRLSAILHKIWCDSTEFKKTKSYFKATKMVMITSLVFILLNSPMAFSKMYTFFKHDLKYKIGTITEIQNITNLTGFEFYETYSEDCSPKLEEKNHDLKKQIYERVACYLYYLNFCLNLVFYSLTWPKKARKKLICMTKSVANFKDKMKRSYRRRPTT